MILSNGYVKCDGCAREGHAATTLFEVRDGALLIKQIHHGREHTTVVEVSRLAALVGLDKEALASLIS
jgi:hypothetical protein